MQHQLLVHFAYRCFLQISVLINNIIKKHWFPDIDGDMLSIGIICCIKLVIDELIKNNNDLPFQLLVYKVFCLVIHHQVL